MQSGTDREREDLLKELRKRGKKDFLLPLMVLLKIPDPNRHRSDTCLELIANRLQEMIQGNRANSQSDAEGISSITRLLSPKAGSHDDIVNELRGIL